MSALFWNTITEDMRLVLREFFNNDIGQKFYLAGGTALSLQLGHRHSIDLDLFSPTEDIPSIRASLEEALSALKPQLADSSWGNLVFVASNVRVGLYGYGYSMIDPIVEEETLRLASIRDIALMKMDAILSRANRKDFYDLYFIAQAVPLKELFEIAPKKYPSVRDFEVQVTKRLVYFDSADNDPDPIFLEPVSWKAVREYFMQQAKEIEQGWLK
ncbi:MAG TPA: nucleotidyl transferase AbiEii/AbiGii toxin family protein [Anaerolineales bacterium]|nr:nucleotidyl transferase AbiEii/AbiGii toxin family protein [Anaerolineales bacterium]HMR99050.1 nucleotidyl transferase AbiEii/AbiGii toxin family protein [Anaerolineales bacterium]HNQ93184.1 nucleotidyl transferase AbiEii/AbiGii toxin family protein [Anaerolineales bacterium]HNS60375.1 nucleotidyl transferase AbiEii/AbiGii toxin family protein [Anaerolineales bacterium]